MTKRIPKIKLKVGDQVGYHCQFFNHKYYGTIEDFSLVMLDGEEKWRIVVKVRGEDRESTWVHLKDVAKCVDRDVTFIPGSEFSIGDKVRWYALGDLNAPTEAKILGFKTGSDGDRAIIQECKGRKKYPKGYPLLNELTKVR